MNEVPFDPDLAAIEMIHPEFIEEVVGWANEELLVEEGWEPIVAFGVNRPVDWMPTRRSPIEPRPIVKRRLVWLSG
jgi:hypothetical protein